MTAPRPDLLALSDDALATLANRGIVKRSLREVADGKGPTLAVGDDETVTGTFGDGTTVVFPPGTDLEAGSCTCPASGVCRHRVMVVLAFRSLATTLPSEVVEAWSPGELTDDDLEDHLGSRVLGIARKALRAGYRARIRHATPADPVPTVELPSCTVRFLVPHELAYARVDAARGSREDAVALAVWACRAAEEAGTAAPEVEVEVGGDGLLGRTPARGSGIEPVLDLLGDLLAHGVVHTGEAISPAVLRARRALDRRNLRWPVDALDELADQLDAYRARSARYAPTTVAALVAELIARHRCVAGGGAALRPGVLGTEEAAETPLRLLRLTGLGARVVGDDRSRTIEVYLAHPDAGVVMTVRRRIEAVGDDAPPPAHELGRRRAGGVRLSAIAAGNVVTESAVRAANRLVRIAESRIAKTTVTPSAGAWDQLPPSIVIGDLDAEAARLAGLPPAIVRPRVAAESVRAIAVASVDDVTYRPGDQRLVAAVHAPVGRATVTLTHTSATAGAIDALARALGGDHGPIRFVAGHLRRHGGELVIEPSAVVVGDTVVVPAFEPPSSAVGLASTTTSRGEPLATALHDALAASAEVLHRGYRHLPPAWATRLERSAENLRQVGLTHAATAMASLGTSFDLDRWANTHLRLLVTNEQL